MPRLLLPVAFALLSLPLGAQQPAERILALNDLPRAKSEFGAALQRNPRDADALFNLGRIAFIEGRSAEAIGLLERAIKVDPRQASYHLWLGNSLGMEAQRASKVRQPFLAKRVRSAFERTVELDPGSVAAREGLMQFYLIAPGVMGGSEPRAREQLAEIRRLNPMRGYFGDAMLAARAKDTVAAEKAFREAVGVAPDSIAAHFALANFYQRSGRWDEAMAVYDALAVARPGELGTLYQVGRLGAISGKFLPRAEASLKRWMAAPPPDATATQRVSAHWRLGQIYEQTGRRELARGEYQAALKRDPGHREAKAALEKMR
jgi:tetratricopeptide (TPR) repeat protein